MPRRHSFWSVLNATLGGVAAIVTAATGLYLALRSEPSSTVSASGTAPVSVAAQPESSSGTIYDRTPWLGIELRQGGQQIPLRSVGDAWDQFDASLASGPFEIQITRGPNDPSIGIVAWHDDSIFACADEETLHLPGTGIAGGRFALPILYLNKEGFNYYDTERLKRIADDKYAIHVTTIGSGELELPLARFAGPIHLIVFRAPGGFEMTVPRRDFEMFTLLRQ